MTRRFVGAAALAASFAMLIVGCANYASRSGSVAALSTVLAQLQTEAQRVQDVSEIKRLQRAYGYYVDQHMWDEVADLFTQDATFELGLDGVYVGRERIRKYLYTLGGGSAGLKHGQLDEHMQLQPVVHVSDDGRTAKARWRAFIMAGEFQKSAVWGEGTYENEYVKENGVWKISKLHWYQTFLVPYEGGWAKNKDVTGGVLVSRQLPPDRPPTVSYQVWPNVYIPPFHYRPALTPAADLSAYMNPNLDADPQIAALQKAIAHLARRIQRLRDTDDIEKLVSAYGYYLDKQQWDQLASLFAKDCTMEISQRGVYVGRHGVRRALELFGPQNIEKDHLHNHIQMQPVIHIAPDGERAWVRSRALSQLGTFGKIGVWGDGVYENEFVKENGTWRFKVDHVYTTFFAPYDSGWAMGARAAPKASTRIPPDRPPTEVYEALPGIYTPRFHYPHPVTGSGPSPEPDLELDQLPPRMRDAVAKLARQVERLEDEDAIENLQRIYGFYVDKAMWREAADLFAGSGTIEVGDSGVFVGKARVRAYLTQFAPQGLQHGMLRNHLQLQPIITVAPDGRTAKGRWRFLDEIGEYQKAESALWGTGTLENEYVKEDGVWKIAHLRAFPRMYAQYDAGWAKSAERNPRPAQSLPPDRPSTITYEMYPAPYVPPFHYVHPVTKRDHADAPRERISGR
ncbi:MAG TPA: nuclear transport factor 2 family protein [Steroidobacteraceae bacterium]